jgi:hypothetical protein
MARPLRVDFDGALYPVTPRGNARENIFDEDGDHKAFLEILGKEARIVQAVHRYGYSQRGYRLSPPYGSGYFSC